MSKPSVWEELERSFFTAPVTDGIIYSSVLTKAIARGRALERVAEAAKEHPDHLPYMCDLCGALAALDKESKNEK